MIGGMELEGLKEFEQSVFGNASSLYKLVNSGEIGYGAKKYGLNTINLLTNAVHPAWLAQDSKAMLKTQTTTKSDTFLGEVKNLMLQRSSWLRAFLNEQPPSKLNAWGDVMPRGGSHFMKVAGVSKQGDDFAKVIYDDSKRTGENLYPPAVIVPDEIGGVKLTASQKYDYEKYIKQERKKLIEPFIDDQSIVLGKNKYSELSDDDKKRLLELQYIWGRSMGIIKFKKKYPEFKVKKELIDLDETTWGIYKSLNTPKELQLDFSEYYED
jgi:hypothetical protein